MRQIDSEAIQKYKIPRIILMEHAGLEVAKTAAKFLSCGKKNKIFVFSGTGYNGGDGLVAARHLINWGFSATIVLVGSESKCKPETKSNLDILKKLNNKIIRFKKSYIANLKRKLKNVDLIIDSILGIGLEGEVRPPISDLINILNKSKVPILSVDAPSGLNSNTGEKSGVCIKAFRTVTFTAPKKGFFLNEGPESVGEVTLRNIGIPRRIIEKKSKEKVI